MFKNSIKPLLKLQYNMCKTAILKKTKKKVFKANYCFMQVKSVAECSKGSILQYFQPSLSYQLSLIRPLFCLFLSGPLTKVLLYRTFDVQNLTVTGLQIYGGPGSFSHDFKIWPITF